MDEEVKIVELSTGEKVNLFCMKQFDDLTLNTEVIWDILEVITELSNLKITRNDSGNIEDIKLCIPKVDEKLVLFSLRNFIEFQKMRNDEGISAESILELRRIKIKKYIEGKND